MNRYKVETRAEEKVLAIICISLAITAGSCMAGCAGRQRPVERALSVGARAIQGIDSELTPLYVVKHRACLDASDTREAYTACMGSWETVGDAMEVAREALLAAEATYLAATGEDAGEGRWMTSVACVRVAITHLIGALDAVGVETPDSLMELIHFAGQYLGDCVEA